MTLLGRGYCRQVDSACNASAASLVPLERLLDVRRKTRQAKGEMSNFVRLDMELVQFQLVYSPLWFVLFRHARQITDFA